MRLGPAFDVPLPDLVLTGACGDVVAARSDARALLSRTQGGGRLTRLGRLLLTATIVDHQCRGDRAVRPSDLIRSLLALARCGARPFADSPMQFLQFVDAELEDVDLRCRIAAVELCLSALGRVR